MRRKKPVAKAVWLLAAVALAGLAWVWWHAGQSAKPPVASVKAPSPTEPAFSRSGDPSTNQAALPRRETSALKPVPVMVLLPYHPHVPADTNRHAPVVAIRLPGGSNATGYPRPVQNVFEMQVVLADQGISCGSLDGLIGPQTRSAVRSFQQKEHLPITGQMDAATREALLLTKPATVAYVVTSNDLARLQPLSSTWLGKSQQTALDYESILELVAERSEAHPGLIRRLNPGLDWTNVAAGVSIELPNVCPPPPGARAASIVVKLGDKILEAWDENTNLLAHFPCSIARQVEKRPVGELHVAVIAPHPNYTFDPDIFPESTEARELKTKLVLPPGPNNPVGVAWMGLDKPGYGIHGTPSPELVGRTESHGCFRLANWNAEYLLSLVAIGTPVFVQP